MPLFEVETENHIVITWAEDGDAASAVVGDAYPQEHVMRLTKRPRDTWVISKSALGISGRMDPCHSARDCLAMAEGDKVHAIRLYMQKTGADLEQRAKRSNRIWSWAGNSARAEEAETHLGESKNASARANATSGPCGSG